MATSSLLLLLADGRFPAGASMVLITVLWSLPPSDPDDNRTPESAITTSAVMA